ncbi:MAG: cysteine desulfurase NifS [Vulcanimicrobiota bacterium]
MNNYIYMDHAATTYVDPQVFEYMKPYFSDIFYNASSLYSPARDANQAIADARKTVARYLNAQNPDEIIFTSGGSESDNLAIFGMAMAHRDKGNHIITLPLEHHAVLHAVEAMDKLGFEHTIVDVDEDGIVNPQDIRKAITDKTILITVMMANNEIGTIEPIREIGEIAREKGILFHTDAVQAAGALPIDVDELNVDALSISAHKFYGPKGVGALYLRQGTAVIPHLSGGSQENHRRAGTYNTPGIVGLAKALELACENMEENNKKISGLRDRLVEKIMEKIPHTVYSGHPVKRLPNNASFCFKFIDSEAILLHMDMLGICASAGSACTASCEGASHVLSAIGVPFRVARGNIRFTLGKRNTEKEVDFVVEKMVGIVEKLRKMSPFSA